MAAQYRTLCWNAVLCQHTRCRNGRRAGALYIVATDAAGCRCAAGRFGQSRRSEPGLDCLFLAEKSASEVGRGSVDRMNYPAVLSFFCGFISLSVEILWVRLYGFAMLSTPAAFGFVLMAYLTGIALGARLGGKACRENPDSSRLWRRVIWTLLLSAVLALVMPFVFAWGNSQWWRNPLV